MKNQYSKEVQERFFSPKHFGEMKEANGVGKVGNPQCGDQMTVYLKIKDDKIVKASFQTLGCVAAIATSDVVCEMVEGKSIKEASLLTQEEMIKKLQGLPMVKVHCSSLAIEGLKEAIKDYEKR